jgi:protein-tyrosine phosphatase
MRLRRSTVPVLALALLLPACGSDGDDGPAIPFTEASVVQDGTEYTITWAAEDAGEVAVFAGTDPAAVGRDREVGTGDEEGELVVDDLPDAARWYFELVPEDGEPLVLADRSLHLASAPNFRDVGGYRTEDGRWVRMGLVYRSDGLDELSDEDRAKLHDLGIKLVCDLRTDGERESKPDREIEGARNEQFDVAADSGDLTKVITDAILSGDAAVQEEMLGDGKGEKLMTDGGRDMVSGDTASAAYTLMFDRLADDTALPTVFHCTAGKDRTGWAAAALLTTLGVPRDVVMADYLRSNDELAEETAHTLERVQGLIDEDLIEPVIGVRREYLEASFTELDEAFGGIDGYLADRIDVDDEQRERLEELLLAG